MGKQIISQIIFIRAVTVAATTLATVSGCNYNDIKNQPGQNAGRTAKATVVDFETVRSQVFEPACIKCHGPTLAKAGLRLDQYASAFGRLGLIRSEVVGGTMPPGPPRGTILQPEQKVMLIAWIDSGGPENTVATPAVPPGTVPATPPVVGTPSFADVSSAVFVPHCIKCHSSTEMKGKVNLEDYANAAKHASDIGDALDIDDMPRKAPALPANLKAIVYAWIAGGAPEFAAPAPATPATVINENSNNHADNN